MLKPQFIHLLLSIFFVLVIKVMIWKNFLFTFVTFDNQIHNINEIYIAHTMFIWVSLAILSLPL
jgi:hypothetical protein